MPATEKTRFRLPEEPVEAMKIRGLPVSHAMTIRSTLPSPTTVEYATAAYEWIVNPTVRNAVFTSLEDFMLPPSPSTLFTSSFNPPVSSYYANDPDPSIFSQSSSSLPAPSSSTSRRNTKRHGRNPYPSFSSSSHSLAQSSADDFFDFNDYSSLSPHTASAGHTEIEMSQAGPSRLAAPSSPMGLSPLPMAESPAPMGLDPSSDLYPTSPMMWSPPPGESIHLGPLSDFQHFTLPDTADNLGPGPSTSDIALLAPSQEERPYELQGIQSSGNFMPVVAATPTTVALDDNASLLSTNTAASSSVGAAGDLNAILKSVFSDSGNIFEGAEFRSTKSIKRELPVVATIGKSSRLVMQAASFAGAQWTHVGISQPNAISPLSQLTLDIFCKLQLMHAQIHGDKRPIEFCKYPLTLVIHSY